MPKYLYIVSYQPLFLYFLQKKEMKVRINSLDLLTISVVHTGECISGQSTTGVCNG